MIKIAAGELEVRLATEEDLRYAEYTFRDSFRTQFWAGPLVPWARDEWKAFAEPQIRRILRDRGVAVHVAYNPELGPETQADIVGWLAVRGTEGLVDTAIEQPGPSRSYAVRRPELPLVIYVYVKEHFRTWGVGRALFRHVGLDPWKDAYQYACKTDILLAWPAEGSPWPTPVIQRMERAQWNPRATRGGNRRYARQDHDDRRRPER